jgi:hypothetical protein
VPHGNIVDRIRLHLSELLVRREMSNVLDLWDLNITVTIHVNTVFELKKILYLLYVRKAFKIK